MSDLIKQLRSDGAELTQNDCDAAADKIERLTAENEKLSTEGARLRELLIAEGWSQEGIRTHLTHPVSDKQSKSVQKRIAVQTGDKQTR